MVDLLILGGLGIVGLVGIGIISSSMKQVRPMEKGVIERWGKFDRLAEPGLHFLMPFAETIQYVPTMEIRVVLSEQTVITKDNLNCIVDAMVYYKIQDVQKAIYSIQNYQQSIPALAQTTLRAVMGQKTLTEANSDRQSINKTLAVELNTEALEWGVKIIRVEIQKIEPPENVQQTMNAVVQAEKTKQASLDLASAKVNEAEGAKQVTIKEAEAEAERITIQAKADASAININADAQAKAIKAVNEAAEKYFVGNAQLLKKLEVAQASLENNTKYIMPQGSNLTNVISEAAGIIPVSSDDGRKIMAKLEQRK